MPQLETVIRASPRNRLRLPMISPYQTVGLTLGLTLLLCALPFLFPSISDVPVLAFVVAIGLCASRFGLTGGLGAGLTGVAVATLWFVHGGHFTDGAIDYAVQAFVFLLVGGLVGDAVSERRALEHAITQQHDQSRDLICTVSFDGYFVRLNPAWRHVLGYELDELLGKPLIEFVHPEDRLDTVSMGERQTRSFQEVVNFQNRYRHKDGSYRWMEWNSRPERRTRLVYAVGRDITDRKHAERALADHNQMLERAVAERTAELEEARLEVLGRLARAAEYRDDDTYEHTARVGAAAGLMALELGYSDQEAQIIRQAAQLHDIGKLGLSDTILLKPGSLTREELALVEQHTVDGAQILSGSGSEVLQVAEQIALAHHERWDGTGYPHRLRGDAIPLPARIVALADVFDALTHCRPYKQAWPVEEAVAEILRARGTHFDPAVVDVFARLNPYVLAGLPARPVLVPAIAAAA
jgi:PAS domain S-box-containing protein/putative nucleotidyltransferase with HDIG domain